MLMDRYDNTKAVILLPHIQMSYNAIISLLFANMFNKLSDGLRAGVTNLFTITGHFVRYHKVRGPHNFLVNTKLNLSLFVVYI